MAKLSDDRIIGIIQFGIGQAVGFAESKLSRERARVLRFYDGEHPRRTHQGDSSYYSLDVYEGVEQMKSQLLETFSGNKRPVKFSPQRGETDAQARLRTDYVTDVVFNQNPGFQIIRDVVHDGLMGRAGVAKVWWDIKTKVDHYDITDTTLQEVAAFLAENPDASIKDYEVHEDGETFKRVRIKIKEDRSQVRIKVLPPEEFLISPMAEDIETADLVIHRRQVTRSDLIKMGFKKALVEQLQDNDRIWMQTEPELIARHETTDDLIGTKALEDGQKSRRTCMLYECYLELDMDQSGESHLHKVMMVGDTVLDKEPVDRKPFCAFIPLPVAHKFWGVSYAALLVPTQTANTYLTRSIINHTLITNNPRLQVVRGTVLNPRELMENRMGGIVNVTRPDGVLPLPQGSLNPFVFSTIQMLQDRREKLTGISELSQGLNKDAVSKQNSAEMVQDLISVSQIRQKIVARNFAEGFLRALYTEVYRLVVENENRQKIIKVAGGWVPVDFTAWPESAEMDVSFTLGYGEMEKEGQKWVGFDHYMQADPELKQLYPLPKRFAVLQRIAATMGIHDITEYAITPEQMQPAPPNPMMMAELQVKQADAQVKQANAQAAVEKLKLDQQIAAMEAQEREQKLQQSAKAESDKIALERDKLAHKIAVDAAQLILQQDAARQAKMTAVAEPTRS